MESTSFTVSLTPIQQVLTMAFQIWMIIFPIILIRKINYLTTLLEEQFTSDENNDSTNNKEPS